MSIYDFYLKFASEGERNPLFAALHKLSRLEDPRKLFTSSSEEEEARGWPVWDEGVCRRVAGLLAATPA